MGAVGEFAGDAVESVALAFIGQQGAKVLGEVTKHVVNAIEGNS